MVGNARRDILMAGIGAAVCTAALIGGTELVASHEGRSPEAVRDPSGRMTSPEGPCPSQPPGSSSDEPRKHEEGGVGKMEQVQAELQDLKSQRGKLQEQLRAVEKELRKKEAPPRYDYDLTRDQWRELAAAGRIKYRIPCPMSADSEWSIGAPILDQLGLSPDDGKIVEQAFRRSNARVWAIVKPMCAELVEQEELMELLGINGCKLLIERTEEKREALGIYEAQRLVAEVRAGMREPLTQEELPSKLYQLYWAMTAEGGLFEADLGESFGPEVAERIWHGFPCSKTSR
jgi:hypothetical protein